MAKILVADDDRIVRFTLADGLRQAGYEVIEAQDGESALELCRNEDPALALLDIRMPGLDGLELARRLKEESDVPFVFFSAYGDEAFVQQAIAAGALGYLIKPLSVAAILPMIQTALARARDISSLEGALASNRTIATAVGILMQQEGLDQPAAFERLRESARKHRRKMLDVALQIIEKSVKCQK